MHPAADRSGTRQGLGMLFWGTLVLVLDFRIEGFDLLPDLAGAGFAAVGLVRLNSASGWAGDPTFGGRMTAAIGLAWLVAAFAVTDLLRVDLAGPVALLGTLADFAAPVAAAGALHRLAQLDGDGDVVRRMRTSIGLLGTAALLSLGLPTLVPEPTDALVVAAVVFVLGAMAHYLVSVHRSRAMY